MQCGTCLSSEQDRKDARPSRPILTCCVKQGRLLSQWNERCAKVDCNLCRAPVDSEKDLTGNAEPSQLQEHVEYQGFVCKAETQVS